MIIQQSADHALCTSTYPEREMYCPVCGGPLSADERMVGDMATGALAALYYCQECHRSVTFLNEDLVEAVLEGAHG